MAQKRGHRALNRELLSSLPEAEWLLADGGYDANWFRNALRERGSEACIPSRKSPKVPVPHDKIRYKARYKIENMFGRLKDWHSIATRYNRCPDLLLAAITLAATAIFWL